MATKVWRASFLLVDYLAQQSISKSEKVHELGCGWGAASSFVQRQFQAHVEASDADVNVEPFLSLLNKANNSDVAFVQASFKQLASLQEYSWDIFIGADICYSETAKNELVELISKFLQQSGRQVILSDIGRSYFMELVEELTKQERLKLSLVKRCLTIPVQVDGYILHLMS